MLAVPNPLDLVARWGRGRRRVLRLLRPHVGALARSCLLARCVRIVRWLTLKRTGGAAPEVVHAPDLAKSPCRAGLADALPTHARARWWRLLQAPPRAGRGARVVVPALPVRGGVPGGPQQGGEHAVWSAPLRAQGLGSAWAGPCRAACVRSGVVGPSPAGMRPSLEPGCSALSLRWRLTTWSRCRRSRSTTSGAPQVCAASPSAAPAVTRLRRRRPSTACSCRASTPRRAQRGTGDAAQPVQTSACNARPPRPTPRRRALPTS